MINQYRRISNILVNYSGVNLLSFLFRCYYRDGELQPHVVWTGSFLTFHQKQKGRGQQQKSGGRTTLQRLESGSWAFVRGCWLTLVTHWCFTGLLSLFVTSFLIRSWEMMYQLIDLRYFFETPYNRILTFLCCY